MSEGIGAVNLENNNLGNSSDNNLFEKAEKSFQTADHMLYFVYPMLKDPKLIKKALEEIFNSAKTLVNAILLFEHKKNKIRIYQDKNQNLETFKKISQKLDISAPELGIILEIITFNEKHEKSPTEFVRSNHILILLDNSKYESISMEKLKSYINIIKTIIQKFRLYKGQKF